MTRLDRIIEVFEQYHEMLDEIIWTKDQEDKLTELHNKANVLIDELKRYGCRREGWL